MADKAIRLGIYTVVLGLMCGCGDTSTDTVPQPSTKTDSGTENDAIPSPDTVEPADLPTPSETVTPGECASHEDCDDEIECTSDVCTIDGICVNELADDVCRIDDVCMASGTVNPDNICEVCDATNFTDQWTPRPAILCDDGDPCTEESHCNKGVCVGEPMAACCGNGIVEPGETCDGDCPAECVPTGTCKEVYQQIGSAETCDLFCKIGPVQDCVSDDGCCPKGCGSATDNDCEESCGNNVLEPGELCDGDCPTACFNSNACINAELVGDPSTCNAQCVKNDVTACISGDGCCPTGCNETSDDDCVSHPCELEIDIQCNSGLGAPATFQITALDPEQPDGKTPHGYLFFNWGDENIGFDDLLTNFCLNQTGVFSMQEKTGCVVATFEIGTCLPLDYPKACQAKQCYTCP